MRIFCNAVSGPAIVAVLLSLSGSSVGAQTNSTSVGARKSFADAKEMFQEFRKRNEALRKISNTRPTDWQAYESAVRAKMRDFPDLLSRDIFGNAYGDLAVMIWHYEKRDPDKALALAKEIAGSSAPEKFRVPARGYLKRKDRPGKPIAIRFQAMDGRDVDTAAMSGRVVLVDFWATTCPGCVADMPRLKTAFEKFHAQGLEVIGISSDTEAKVLQRFIKRQELPWPQHFAGGPDKENKLFEEFGIYHEPHVMLLDKQGCLRFDDLDVRDGLEQKIAALLSEQMP